MIRRLALLIALFLTVLTVAAAPASGHPGTPDHGDDRGSVNCDALGCTGSPPDPEHGCIVGLPVDPCGSTPVSAPEPVVQATSVVQPPAAVPVAIVPPFAG